MEPSGVYAYPREVSPETPVTIVAWFRKTLLFKEASRIIVFGSVVRGLISVSLLEKPGVTGVEWVIPLENSWQAKAAAEVLAKMLSLVAGVRLVGYQLADNAEVARTVKWQ